MKTFSGFITSLAPNQIFVFGSNPSGIHGAGAARFALDHCGAVLGVGHGLCGQSYAIATKDLNVKRNAGRKSVSLEEIGRQVDELLKFAKEHPELEFLITKFGCERAGYEVSDIAGLFLGKWLPDNLVLNEDFAEIIYHHSSGSY